MALLTALGLGGAAGAAGAAGGAAATAGAAGAIGTLGTAASIVGTGMGVVGQFQQAKAQKKAEQLRERQMNLEAARSRREIARKAVVARSEALSTGVAQGAQFGSGVQGGMAQITGTAARDTLAVNQNQEIGKGIFDANYDSYRAGTLSSIGQGFQSIGQNMVQNRELYGRVGTYYGFG